MQGNRRNFLPKSMRMPVLLVGVKLVCTLLAVSVFARFSPLVDADLYLSGFYSSESAFRTRVIQWLVTLFSNFGGAYFAHWSFGIVSLSGLFYYYWKGGARWQLCLFLLLPSTMIWTSVIGKEAIFYGGFTLSLVVWVRFVTRKCTGSDYFFLIVAVLVCVVFRPHYAVAIAWLFLSTFLVDKTEENAWIWLSVSAFLGCCMVYAFVWDELLLRGFGGIEPSARASRFLLLGIDKKTSLGFEIYKSLIPQGALLGIIGPMPSELLARPVFIPFFLEGILILLFPVLVYIYANSQILKEKKRFNKIFWMCLAPAVFALMVLHAPFGLLNPGSATRWRVNFEAIFHLAPLMLFYGFFDDDRRENRPLSS